MNEIFTLSPAPLWRRLAALIYDALLVLAIWFVTTGLIVLLLNHLHIGMENDNGVGRPHEWILHDLLLPLLVFEAWAFYAWFWMHGGQTLGMKSWHIQVVDYRGRRLKVWQTVARFVAAWLSAFLAGAGFWLVLFAPHQSLHDRLSASETRMMPKTR